MCFGLRSTPSMLPTIKQQKLALDSSWLVRCLWKLRHAHQLMAGFGKDLQG